MLAFDMLAVCLALLAMNIARLGLISHLHMLRLY